MAVLPFFILMALWRLKRHLAQNATRGANLTERLQPGAPGRHLIPGVPFVSWGEAAALNYQAKDIFEPSAAAGPAMNLEYCGYSPKLLEDPEPGTDKWPNVSKKGAMLGDIKQVANRDIPVAVFPTLTPFAHRLYVGLALFADITGFDIRMAGSSAKILGRMVSWKDRAKKATKRTAALCSEQSGRKVARMLAKDFRIAGCKGEYRGMGRALSLHVGWTEGSGRLAQGEKSGKVRRRALRHPTAG